MAQHRFNPFEDRLSRDIRNDLSEALLDVLATASLLPARQAADRYLAQNPPSYCRDYIDDRLQRYENALAAWPRSAENSLDKAAILWDLGLHFEVHEILEPEWITAKADRKLQLQALIRAAGVYINLAQGYRQRAAKIAAKALPMLRLHETSLKTDLRVDRLIAALEQLFEPSPQIRIAAGRPA